MSFSPDGQTLASGSDNATIQVWKIYTGTHKVYTLPTYTSGSSVNSVSFSPDGQTLGEFLNDHGDFLHIQSDVFGGNSGGPVLNKQGTLIGIVARSDRHMNALAIPMRDINRLLSQSQLKHSRSYR